ncbi:unnamed protein product [Vicia faba]|uniref:F-box associated beta-propeller type 1 domain-containing protein n=1 Tax=Vicia faba TaxID=3906 RepID=A0AAV1ASU8_VICFA|nr:unnamed protein product [Vicia faba]
MNLLPTSQSRRTPTASVSPISLPDELIAEVLSCLTVRPLMRMRGTISWFMQWIAMFGSLFSRLSEYSELVSLLESGHRENITKVLALMHTKVRVFSLQDNAWSIIQNPPMPRICSMNAVYLSGSVNWLACHGVSIRYPQFVIVSFDLGAETHTQFQSPPGFDQLPSVHAPNLTVLKDCLCFCHDFKQTHFVIWLMNKIGVEDSWTQFFKISYHNLQIDPFEDLVSFLIPICVSEKNDTLLLANEDRKVTILYNWRENRIALGPWWCTRLNYVESLVSHC